MGVHTRTLRLTLVSLAFFVLGFVLVARPLRGAFPSSGAELFERKLVDFENADPPYDAVFVGSSRVYRHVDPAMFDSILARSGIATHSYNFGFTATTPLETPRVIRRIFAQDRASAIRRVFVSLEDLEWKQERDNLRSDRVSRYFDWKTMNRVTELALANEALTMRDRAAMIAARVPAFVRHATGLGRGGDWIRSRLGLAEAPEDLLWEHHERGYMSLDSALVHSTGVARTRYQRRHTKLLLSRRDGVAVDADSTEIDASYQLPVLEELVAEIRDLVNSHGAELVLFTRNPDSGGINDLEAVRSAGAVKHVILLDDPERYPELFGLDHRFDTGHFTAEGASFYTKYLAEAFVALHDSTHRP